MCPFVLDALGRCIGDRSAKGEGARVYLRVQAPQAWIESVKESLALRLEAIPNVEIVEDEHAAALTVWADVAKLAPQGRGNVGFSLAALVYSIYPQTQLVQLARAVAPESEAEAFVSRQKGHIRLAGMVHAQGARDEIADAYDRIVATVREEAAALVSKGQPQD